MCHSGLLSKRGNPSAPTTKLLEERLSVDELRQPESAPIQAGGLGNERELALVARVLRKDRKATAEFVARFTDDLFRYVRSRLSPHYDHVDDLVQDTFVSAWENLSHFRGSGPLRAWLLAIARHKVEDYYRARFRAPEPIEGANECEDGSTSEKAWLERLEQHELRKRTRQVLAKLPEQYRLALIWRYWEKTSARDMALKTGKTEKAIERLLARARAEFRERWNRG